MLRIDFPTAPRGLNFADDQKARARDALRLARENRERYQGHKAHKRVTGAMLRLAAIYRRNAAEHDPKSAVRQMLGASVAAEGEKV